MIIEKWAKIENEQNGQDLKIEKLTKIEYWKLKIEKWTKLKNEKWTKVDKWTKIKNWNLKLENGQKLKIEKLDKKCKISFILMSKESSYNF